MEHRMAQLSLIISIQTASIRGHHLSLNSLMIGKPALIPEIANYTITASMQTTFCILSYTTKGNICERLMSVELQTLVAGKPLQDMWSQVQKMLQHGHKR